jgi:penicillin-binding protein 2
VEAHRRDHPEIQLGPEPRRLYKYKGIAAHVLGYVAEVSEEELGRDAFPEAKSGDLVGKFGIEKVYNRQLTGKDGRRQVLVDSLGREVGLLDEIDSMVGGELQLTLDLDLQKLAERLLEERVGAIVAMDPRNGEILALASAPTFDPNSLSTRISEEDWTQLINNPDKPLQDRAIQNSYSPGSIFKLIMSEAGLEEGFISEETHVVCTGAATFYNRLFHCAVRKGHGYIDLQSAIARSCNIFFYELGRRMGISKIAQHARELGLGEKAGVDLPGEKAGVMPSPEWKLQARGTKWFAGETISVSIGQGAISVTPLQMLRAISCIATAGKLVTPHVLLRADRLQENVRWPERQVSMSYENAHKIRQGMWASVNNFGTGHNAAVPGFDVCGKTGTVQLISNEGRKEAQLDSSIMEDHSWFGGFASRDNPEIAVVVMIEHGGKGGIAAAPMAREIFQTYFAKQRRPELITQLKASEAANRQ